MEIIKKIKNKYVGEDGFPLYINLEDFIERNLDFVKNEILPKLNIKSFRVKEIVDCSNKDKYVNNILTLSCFILNDLKEEKYVQEKKQFIEFIYENKEEFYILVKLWEYFYLKKGDQTLETNKEEISNKYLKYGLNLKDENKQFDKYGLVSLNKPFKLNGIPPQLNDKRIKKIVLLKNSNTKIVEFLLKIENFIPELSIQLNENYFIDAEDDQWFELISESVEIGSKFELEKLGKNIKGISFDKLCDTNYNNFLWVTKDKENITFEEILDDFSVEGENIITQVIHLQYLKNKITHLDHEYIFYSLEEFKNKKTNYKIKGHKKVKTFKIDNSQIPFILETGEFTLYEILEIYFQRKDLLNEYFEKYV